MSPEKKIVRRETVPAEPPGDLDQLIQRLYRSRGYTPPEQDAYLLKTMLPPAQLRGVEEGAALLECALRDSQHILIVGDFDADGATSTALAVRCLKAMGAAKVNFLVPNRFEYGYGLTPEIVAVAARQKPDLLITVDNGIASIEGVAAAREAGIKVLVTDHHLPGEQLPEADAIVNPNQPGCEFGSKNLAGVGVIFYLLCALRGRLRSNGWFAEKQLAEPNMADYLDLVALGTVADVVPLDYNNRTLVAQGLARMRAGQCVPGIRALFQVGRRSMTQLQSADLGFVAGPRLNAAGRLDDMTVGIRLLLADNPTEAMQLAAELDNLNNERKQIERSMQAEAVRLLDDLTLDDAELPMGVCLYRPDWHQGVIGILASRVKERVHRPTIVFADAGDGEIKGSGRSIEGVHLRDVLDEVATGQPGLLTKFGGHAMAAGLSLKKDNLEAFSQAFHQRIDRHLGGRPPEAELVTDGELPATMLSLNAAEALAAAGPWGQAFPEPCFDGEFILVKQRLVGERHLKMVLTPDEYSGVALDAIAFNIDPALWPDDTVERVRLVYALEVNEFRGNRTAQLRALHLEPR